MSDDNKDQPEKKVEKESLQARVAETGFDWSVWHYLSKNLFPDEDVRTLLLYLHYCAARKLDPVKKPAYVVTFTERYYDNALGDWKSRSRTQILPGIYEARLTAHRTGQYLGQYEAELGPMIDFSGYPHQVPEWASVTVIRAIKVGNEVIRAEFTGRSYYREAVTTKQNNTPNAQWSKRPMMMLIKTAEKAALDRAFPEEVGNLDFADNMDGAVIEIDQPIEEKRPTVPGGKKEELPAIEHQTGNDLNDLLKETRPELQPVTRDQGIPGDKPMDGKTIDNEAEIAKHRKEVEQAKKAKEAELKKKGKKKPPPATEPESKIPVDDPPKPDDQVPSFAPLSTGPATNEPPPYGELDLGGKS